MANSVFLVPAGPSGTLSNPTLAADGSASAPSYSFANETGSGFFRIAGDAGFYTSVQGTNGIRFLSGIILRSDWTVGWTAGAPTAAADTILARDGATNTLALKNAANAQTFRIYGTTTGPKYLSLSHDGTNAVIDTAASSGLVSIAPTNATSVTIGKAITSMAGVATAGSFGTSPIVAVAETTGLTNADTNRINYTPAATSGSYRLSGVVNVTAWATPATFTVVTTYKDASGNARTDTAVVMKSDGTIGTSGQIAAVARWGFIFPSLDIDNSATAITLSTTGTFTGTPVYNFQGTLERIR